MKRRVRKMHWEAQDEGPTRWEKVVLTVWAVVMAGALVVAVWMGLVVG